MESIVENYDFHIFAVGESTLSYKIPDDKLRVNGFTSPPFCADCKYATTRAKVLIYYKDHLPIKRRKDLEIVDEMIVTEIKHNKKTFSLLLSVGAQINQ